MRRPQLVPQLPFIYLTGWLLSTFKTDPQMPRAVFGFCSAQLKKLGSCQWNNKLQPVNNCYDFGTLLLSTVNHLEPLPEWCVTKTLIPLMMQLPMVQSHKAAHLGLVIGNDFLRLVNDFFAIPVKKENIIMPNILNLQIYSSNHS